jgi:hypothetical protein
MVLVMGCKKDDNGGLLSIDSVQGTYKGKMNNLYAGENTECEVSVVVKKGIIEKTITLKTPIMPIPRVFEIKENKNGEMTISAKSALGLLSGEGYITSTELYYTTSGFGGKEEFRGTKQ